MEGVNYRVCIIPKGLNDRDSDLSGGSVAVFAFKNEYDYYGKVLNIDVPSAHKLNRPLSAKIRKIVDHLKKRAFESQMKIDYYLASWGLSIADSFSEEYFGDAYISWYRALLQSMPSVEKLANLCQTDPSALSVPLINVVHWLLIGLKEPCIKRVSTESKNRLLQIFKIPPTQKNSVDIFEVVSETVDKTGRKDLFRTEYGFICEAADNVYAFMYHFSNVASLQFFVDTIGYSDWPSGFPPNLFQTVLVVEYSQDAACCCNLPKELDPQLPNVYYIKRTTDIRVSHLIRLKYSCVRLALNRKILNLAGDGIHLCSLFLLSACIAYAMAGKTLLIL